VENGTTTYPNSIRDVSQAGSDVKHHCHKYMNYHVMVHLNDGTQLEGIIVNMNDEGVTILVAEYVDGMDRSFDGAYRPVGFGPRFRRFRPRFFPFGGFGFPFFTPFPFFPFFPGFGGIW
jgi:hypothetical protein